MQPARLLRHSARTTVQPPRDPARTPARTARCRARLDRLPATRRTRIDSGSGSTNKLTRIPSARRSATVASSAAVCGPGVQPAWLVISPGETGTSVHWSGRTSRTSATRSALGSPSMLYSADGWVFSAAATSCTSWGVMCRSSARGCTVMPAAPAARHTSTASSTRGISAAARISQRRHLVHVHGEGGNLQPGLGAGGWRLITGPLRHRSPQLLLHDVHDFLGPRLDLVLVLAFEHDAQQRLGARIADEDRGPARGRGLRRARSPRRRRGLADRSRRSLTRTFNSTCG